MPNPPAMKSTSEFRIIAAIASILVAFQSHAQTNESPAKTESPIAVDEVVANPENFKGTISVTGRVAQAAESVHLFALSCEDACFSMPVRYSGTLPQAGADVVVRGQLGKDSDGRYFFVAESVTPSK